MKHPYQVLGATVPDLLGREQLLARLDRHLLKSTPDHVAVVGPTLYGKSVFLNHLAVRYKQDSSHYLTSVYIDLRHAPPATDLEFRRRFAEAVKEALQPLRPAISDFLLLDDPDLHELLEMAFDELKEEGVRLLVVLDGFDHVLAGTGLTRNLWDHMRALGQRSSLRLVTGSRRPLRELCKTEESRTSDFWEIFNTQPVFVGPFEEGDLDALLAPFAEADITIDSSARKEILNWTGGIPVLVTALLEELADGIPEGATISKPHIDGIAGRMLEHRRELLAVLWDDCTQELRGDIAAIAAKDSDGGVQLADFSDGRQRLLEARGFGKVYGSRMRSGSRLVAQFAEQQAPGLADLKRLFGLREGFNGNIRGLLELRLSQVLSASTDADLRSYVESAVRDLEPNPEMALKWVRSIADRAFRLIWDAELESGRRLPDSWTNEWKQKGDTLQWLDPGNRLPQKSGLQSRALRLATGANGVRPLARYVTKPTAMIVDTLQSVGDFGQHREEFPDSTVSIGFAAAVVHQAVELVESLERDLARGGDPPR